MKKILIGIDDSKYAEYAADYGFKLAQQLDAEVGLVHVLEPVTAPAAMDSGMLNTTDTSNDFAAIEVMHIQEEQSDHILARTMEKYGQDTKITPLTNFGSTADGILECSKEYGADLIIIGTHSRSGFDRLLMGSVAEHVVRYATMPVLVVPLPQQDI